MKNLIERIKSEDANALIENVIVLPLIFIVIYALILMCFIIHDRSTVESAAKRGAIYAAHCISDPNYESILRSSSSENGALDTSINATIGDGSEKYSFAGIKKNIHPYRYLFGGGTKIDEQVNREVREIIDKTRIKWRDLKVDDVKYKCVNKVLYQDVTVTVKAEYPLLSFFGKFGMDIKYEYEATAKMSVNDPDEFIRNADLIVDVISQIDNKLHITDNIKNMVSKVSGWFGSFKNKK